jgi:hypothetical protein
MKLAQPELHYEGLVFFFERLGVTFRFGMKLVDMGVLRPDAKYNGKPIFLATTESITQHKARVFAYRQGLFYAKENIRQKAA